MKQFCVISLNLAAARFYNCTAVLQERIFILEYWHPIKSKKLPTEAKRGHNKKSCPQLCRHDSLFFLVVVFFYIIPPIPPIPGAPIGSSGLSSFFSTITHSVVRNIPAIEAAFSRATRVTFAGSTTPAAKRFS